MINSPPPFGMHRRRIAKSTFTFVLLAGLGGAIWGLALARALVESFPTSPTFDLAPTLLVALATGGTVAIVWRWKVPPSSSPHGGENWPFPPLAGGIEGGPSLLTPVPLFMPAVYLFWPDVAPQVGWTLLGGSLVLTALLAVGRDEVLPFVLALTTLALYLRTLGPTVGQADTFEFQVVAPTLGVAHPTGYPLYILSGKLFSLLPFGSVAWRVNLTSAIFATTAVVLLYYLIRRIIRRSNQPTSQPFIALVAALAFACSRVFWSQAVVAEVYALHNLFVAAVMFLLVGWLLGGVGRITESLRDTEGTEDVSASSASLSASVVQYPGLRQMGNYCPIGPEKRLFLLAFLLGLSFTNHLTTALLLPAVGLTLLIARPRVGWRTWLAAAGFFFVGLSLYLYIYFRWPTLHDGVWMSLGEFWRYVTGQQFGGALRLDAWRTDPTRYQIVGRLLREPFGLPGLALSALGLAWLAIKRWRVALVTGVTFLAYAWYALSYYVPDVSVFLLPAHLMLAVWLGIGGAVLVKLIKKGDREDAGGRAFVSIAIACLSLLPLWLLWTNLPLVDQSGERAAYTWGERVLDLPLAPDAAILADSVRIAPLYYLQRIEGRRPDLDMLVLADEATYRAQLDARLAGGQTVYLARFLPGLEGASHLRSLGPLTEVGTSPLTTAPPLDETLEACFGDRVSGCIKLLGFTGPVPGPDGGTGLTLYWRADAPVGEVYHVRLRLVDAEEQVWWQTEGRHAADNYYPTPVWRPGEVVADYHEIPPLIADSSTPSGGYTLQVGLFRPFSDEGLVVEGAGMWYSLMPFDPPAPAVAQAPDRPLRARFTDPEGGDGLTLVGVDLPDVVAAGAPVELTLHWRTGDALRQTQPTLTWTDSQGRRVEAQILECWGRVRVSLQAPALPGDYDLRLGMDLQARGPLVARCGWLALATDSCTLATVRVTEAAASALANLDGKMLLLDAELGATALRPGDSMPLTLHWQGLQPMEADYTVSVQLIGPDGRLSGQTDAWPVQGTLPTSQWAPGQPVTDPYQVTLQPDAPPGRYRVGVVVYLLETRTRLPLVDASGRAVGDIAWVGELEVGE